MGRSQAGWLLCITVTAVCGCAGPGVSSRGVAWDSAMFRESSISRPPADPFPQPAGFRLNRLFAGLNRNWQSQPVSSPFVDLRPGVGSSSALVARDKRLAKTLALSADDYQIDEELEVSEPVTRSRSSAARVSLAQREKSNRNDHAVVRTQSDDFEEDRKLSVADRMPRLPVPIRVEIDPELKTERPIKAKSLVFQDLRSEQIPGSISSGRSQVGQAPAAGGLPAPVERKLAVTVPGVDRSRPHSSLGKEPSEDATGFSAGQSEPLVVSQIGRSIYPPSVRRSGRPSRVNPPRDHSNTPLFSEATLYGPQDKPSPTPVETIEDDLEIAEAPPLDLGPPPEEAHLLQTERGQSEGIRESNLSASENTLAEQSQIMLDDVEAVLATRPPAGGPNGASLSKRQALRSIPEQAVSQPGTDSQVKPESINRSKSEVEVGASEPKARKDDVRVTSSNRLAQTASALEAETIEASPSFPERRAGSAITPSQPAPSHPEAVVSPVSITVVESPAGIPESSQAMPGPVAPALTDRSETTPAKSTTTEPEPRTNSSPMPVPLVETEAPRSAALAGAKSPAFAPGSRLYIEENPFKPREQARPSNPRKNAVAASPSPAIPAQVRVSESGSPANAPEVVVDAPPSVASTSNEGVSGTVVTNGQKIADLVKSKSVSVQKTPVDLQHEVVGPVSQDTPAATMTAELELASSSRLSDEVTDKQQETSLPPVESQPETKSETESTKPDDAGSSPKLMNSMESLARPEVEALAPARTDEADGFWPTKEAPSVPKSEVEEEIQVISASEIAPEIPQQGSLNLGEQSEASTEPQGTTSLEAPGGTNPVVPADAEVKTETASPTATEWDSPAQIPPDSEMLVEPEQSSVSIQAPEETVGVRQDLKVTSDLAQAKTVKKTVESSLSSAVEPSKIAAVSEFEANSRALNIRSTLSEETNLATNPFEGIADSVILTPDSDALLEPQEPKTSEVDGEEVEQAIKPTVKVGRPRFRWFSNPGVDRENETELATPTQTRVSTSLPRLRWFSNLRSEPSRENKTLDVPPTVRPTMNPPRFRWFSERLQGQAESSTAAPMVRTRMPLVRPWRDGLSAQLPPIEFPVGYYENSPIDRPRARDHSVTTSSGGSQDTSAAREPKSGKTVGSQTPRQTPTKPRPGLFGRWRDRISGATSSEALADSPPRSTKEAVLTR